MVAAGLAAAIVFPRGILRGQSPEPAASAVNCSYRSDPDQFLSAQSRVRGDVYQRTNQFARVRAASQSKTVDAATLPRRNFIDDEIFSKLARQGIPSAPLSTDEEFLRRIYLDLTGRIPTPAGIRSFVADTKPDKRDHIINTLLFSAEFSDKWTTWFGDLLQNIQTASNVNLNVSGRNALFNWIRNSVYSEKSIKDIAYEAVIGVGNNYRDETATANFYARARTPGGPAQDTYDAMLFRTAAAFLGMSYYDCVLCHNGRGHLDQLSVWGTATTRTDAQRMAAFFSRTRLAQPYQADRTNFLYNSYEVSDAAAGQYDLNTNFGNRPNRIPIAGTIRNLQPEYRETGAKPSAGGNWRAAFAENLVKDPMFARNFANRLWKAMFNLGLVDPVDTLDPARLNPKQSPPEGWSLQATHPELLERLADFFVQSNYSLRETLRLIAQSSAYQLSSRYDGAWNVQYVPLFARHYARRLEGEEVHDAVQQATGVLGRYTVGNWVETVSWAMQLPDPTEPRSAGGVAAFMNTFFRGNRDTQQRNQSGSIQQQLALMNDAFVANRLRTAASPNLQAAAKLASNKEVAEQMFLLFLSRLPSAGELATAASFLDQAGGSASARNTAIEDLAWSCVNKVDFLFSY
jgi:hypothetical protein